jgi:hypothetical protein
VSLFLLKEINIHTISVLIYHFSLLETRAAGAMPRRQRHMRIRDARFSVLYILAHTVVAVMPFIQLSLVSMDIVNPD